MRLPKEEFDFVEEISRELPIRVLARIMGVPDKDLPMCVELGDAMIAQADPEYSRAVIDKEDTSEYRLLPFRSPAAVELMAYGHELAEERRAQPRDDLVTKLVQAEIDGERLSEREFDNFFCLLIVAGNETTRHSITHGMRALVDHPDQWQRLRDDPGLMPLAAEEMLRYGSPTMHFRRTAMRDLELRGTQIREGDKVVVWFVSGNYDEEVFPEADRFDVGRDPNPHMAFGSGGPACVPGRAPCAPGGPRDVRGARPAPVEPRDHRPDRAAPLELHQRHQAHAGPRRTRRSAYVSGPVFLGSEPGPGYAFVRDGSGDVVPSPPTFAFGTARGYDRRPA